MRRADSKDDDRPGALTEGLAQGTLVATPQGWQAAEHLRAGDPVLTFEQGVQPLCRVQHLPCIGPHGAAMTRPAQWPLTVPEGALGNRAPLLLMPDQKLLVESDAAEETWGDPFALIPARALLGWRGIDLCPPPPGMVVIRLGFDGDQVIYAGRGALLSCPELHDSLPDQLAAMLARAGRAETPALSLVQARALVACLMAQDLGAALTTPVLPPGPDQAAV